MNKHTPGPWEETYNTSDNTWGVCLPEGGDVLAQLIENQANATLLAAAPAMYEALKAIAGQQSPNRWGYDSAEIALDDEWRTQARAALAQAEGTNR